MTIDQDQALTHLLVGLLRARAGAPVLREPGSQPEVDVRITARLDELETMIAAISVATSRPGKSAQ